jgi:hypothetical protein
MLSQANSQFEGFDVMFLESVHFASKLTADGYGNGGEKVTTQEAARMDG